MSDKPRILDSQARAESYRGHRNLKLTAIWGGGMKFNLDPDPASAAAKIVDAIRSQYVVRFTAADHTRNGKTHKLEVRLPFKDDQVYSLPTYYAPPKIVLVTVPTVVPELDVTQSPTK